VRQAVQPMPGVDTVLDMTPGEGSTNWSGCPAPVSPDGRRATVFLRAEATDEQREAIAAELRSLPGIASFEFSSKQDAYERFKEIYACAPDLVDPIRPESLPESFIVTLTDPAAGPVLRNRIAGMPGVDTVIHLP
jgi:cell division protein FtsX